MDFTIAFKILRNEDLIISTAPRKSREQLIFIYLVPKVSEVRENHLIMIYKTHFYNSNKQNAVITSNVIYVSPDAFWPLLPTRSRCRRGAQHLRGGLEISVDNGTCQLNGAIKTLSAFGSGTEVNYLFAGRRHKVTRFEREGFKFFRAEIFLDAGDKLWFLANSV